MINFIFESNLAPAVCTYFQPQFFIRMAQGSGTDSLGFFIDTGPSDPTAEVPQFLREEDVEDKVLGSKDAATAEKIRKRAEKERHLSTFLFGSTAAAQDEGVGLESDSSASGSGPSDDELDDDAGDDDDDDASAGEDEKEKQLASGKSVDADSLLPADDYGRSLGQATVRGKKRKAAWKDEADGEVRVKDVTKSFRKAAGKHGAKETSEEQYGRALERRFKSLVGEPEWAKLDRTVEEEEGDSDDEFFRETTDLLEKNRRGPELPEGILDFRKLRDMNQESRSEGAVIRATEFHPTSTVGLVAGLNGTASLFQVDGKTNPKIQTVNFENFPIKCARFSPDGREFLVGSQHHPHLFVYDMMAGKIAKVRWNRSVEAGVGTNSQTFEVSPDGQLLAVRGRAGAVHLLSARTKEYLRSLKMNEECRALKFSKSGAQLYTHGDGGEVYVWDVRSSVCCSKMVDDGCIAGSALAVNRSYLATGSSEGVVNIYSLAAINQSHPKPDKVILNLSTQINQLSFSPSGKMLAIASEMKDNAVKLVHFPSMTVFSNFPGNYNMNRINSLGWSPGSGYLSLGNNRGSALLYRMRHFAEY